MFSTTEKAAATTQVVQQKPAGAFFFRKADSEGFFGNKEARPFFPAAVQPKLEVSHPDDPQEKEADAVAANVMRMGEPAAAPPADEKKEEVQRKEEDEPAVQRAPLVPTRAPVVGLISRQGGPGGFASHGRSEDEGADMEVQAKAFPYPRATSVMRSPRGPPASPDSTQHARAFEQGLSSSKGGGSPLPNDTRHLMESRFGADFSGVRIHTGSGAEGLSASVSAQAFTHGNDIYFNSGKFSPGTEAGGHLLAHELTHTIQQGASRPTADSVAAKSIQRQAVHRTIQRVEAGAQRNAAVELAKAEQGKVVANKEGPDGKRMGWERLLEYFKTTFGADKILPEGAAFQQGYINEAQIKVKSEFKGDVPGGDGITIMHNHPRDAMPSWCGIFAFWALNKGGIPLKKWTLGASMIPPEAAYPPAHQPAAGDLAYRREFSHYALVASSDGATVTSINGNTAGDDNVGGEIQVQTHPKDHWFGFFDPTMLMEGSLRAPGSPDAPGAAPVRSLKELRQKLFKVNRKSEDGMAPATEEKEERLQTKSNEEAQTPAPALAEGQTNSVSTKVDGAINRSTAPSSPPAAVAEIDTGQRDQDQEKESPASASGEFDIDRSFAGGKQAAHAPPASRRPDQVAVVPQPAIFRQAEPVQFENGAVQRHAIGLRSRGPPRAPPVIQALVNRSIQRGWLGDAWDAVSGAISEAAAWVERGLDAAKEWLLGKVRDFVSNIPGYRMLCLILGEDPITGAPTPLTGATLLEAGLDLLPLGHMFRALMTRLGIYNDVALWLEGRIDDLSSMASGIGARFIRFWDGLSLSDVGDPDGVMNRVAELLRSTVEDIVGFITRSASEFLAMIKRVMIREIGAFVQARIPNLYPLLTVALGFDPATNQTIERNGTTILSAFLEVSEAGREQRTQMQDTGTFQKIAAWIDRGIAVFSRAYALLKAAIAGIWDFVTVENLFSPVETFTRIWDQFSEPVRLVGQFLIDAAIEILKVIKDALMRRLSEYARRTRGFTLICVIIGKDPFTGVAVPRTTENLVKGFMSLMDGGEEQYEQLKQSGAIDRIVNKIDAAVARLNMTPRAIIQLFIDLWNAFSIHDLVHPIDCFLRIVATFGRPILRLIAFVIEILMIVVEAVLILMNFPFDLIANIIAKAKLAFDMIKRDPVGFLKNLLNAIKQGFIQFFDNILTHLWNGLKAWFLGEVQAAGIPIPTDFTLMGIIKWLLVVLDITMEKIWKKLEERIGKEKVDKIKKMIAMAERVAGAAAEAVKFVEDVRERGFITVIGEKIMEQLSNAWDMVLEAVQSFVMDQIIKKITVKLLSMLDPTGIMAVVNSAIALYKAIQSFIKYLRQMLEIVNSFVEGTVDIASGAIAKGANFLEGALAKGIPIAIGFFANQVGLNLSERLKDALELVRAKVDAGLTWVIDKLVTVVEKLVALGKSAIAKVKSWLGLETKFDAKDGKPHRLFMSGSEDNPVLMVASNPVAYFTFLSSVQVDATDAKKTNAKTKAVEIAKEIDKRKAKKEAGETDEEKLAAVQKLLDSLAPHTMELFGDPSEAGEPEVAWPAKHGPYGATMTSVRLNKTQTLKGSGPTSSANASYAILNQRRDKGNPTASYYVKGHLLNESIGGPGDWDNLTPLSRTGNSDHESQVESLVKAAWNSGAVVEYHVTANYGRAGNASAIPDTDPDAATKKAIIEEEKNVPQSLKCEAHIMEKTSDKFAKTDKKIVVTTVTNPVEQEPDSYVVSGASTVKSYAELVTEATALFKTASPPTWAVFKSKDAVHKGSVAALTDVDRASLEKLFTDHFRVSEKNDELSKITAMGTAMDIQTWTAFKAGRTFYTVADALSTEVETAFNAKQAALRSAAFTSATAAIPTVAAGVLWRDFKSANNINFEIVTAEDSAKLSAVQKAFEAHKKTVG